LGTILVLDDEVSVRNVLRTRLEWAGYAVVEAGDYLEFTRVMADYEAVLCDIILPGNNGLQALSWSVQHFPNTPVIMITGEPSYETAAEAIRLGAYDYLAKPIHKDELLTTVSRAVERRRLALAKQSLEAENEAYRRQLEQRVIERTRALHESQEFLANLTNTMTDVVISLRLPDYRIEYVNQAVSQVFGYQPEELLGQLWPILYPDIGGFDAFVQKQALMLKAGQYYMRLEQLLRPKVGKSIWTEIAVTCVLADEQPVQMICVIRDISQRSLLLGVVAHELRSPLALLKGFSEVLMEEVDNIDHDHLITYLNSVNTTVARLFTMLNELLDVTSIELGQISLTIESVNLNDLLQTYIHSYSVISRKKNITLIDRLPAQPLICRGDAQKIGQVVSNLIDNAIKYSSPGTAVEIMAQNRESTVWVGVKDEGPGIKSDEIQYLFKNFGRTSARPSGGEKSTGLGLAICKKIIEAHHGEIGVIANPDQGATFWFSLPAGLPFL
jgi:PAS domain S-box-containing protein